MSTRSRHAAHASHADPDRLMTADDLCYRNPYMTLKLEHWRNAGCRHLWVVNPQRQSFTAHDDDLVTTLGADDTFDGGALFPELALQVGCLFD